MVIYVYLDQWVWIRLAKALKDSNGEDKRVCESVIEASKTNKAVFPLSFSHYLETARRQDEGSRKRLADFMGEISNGNAILLHTSIFRFEIRNVIRKIIGQQEVNLLPFVFGKGIHPLYGSRLELTPTVPNPEPIPLEKLNLLHEKVHSGEFFAEVVAKPQFAKEISKGLDKKDEDLAKTLEALRINEYSHPDKTIRDSLARVRFLLNVVSDILFEESVSMSIDPMEIIRNLNSRKDCDLLLESLPTLNTFFLLNHAAKRNISRPIKPNDLYDIGALSIAIPYCDVVVTEREWANIAKGEELDSMYNTVITSNLNELRSKLI